jgi:capsular polysaccharide export protein
MVFNRTLIATGFSFRKRALLRQFTQRDDIHFLKAGEVVPPGAEHNDLILWGRQPSPSGIDLDRFRIIRVEDGFLRSVGLGADLVRPVSWVFDTKGIYFDSNGPSELEIALEKNLFQPHEIKRAAVFRERIVANGISKYNLSGKKWSRPTGKHPVVLVAGQVESDASIRFGTSEVNTNIALLKAARTRQPDAFLVYKPHPDVVAGLRKRGAGEDEAARWVDEVLVDAAPTQLLDQIDEVHVMTSLLGFEALLRNVKVVCHGQPFYSGWGLTEDIHPVKRRTRRLTIDELVVGVLLNYPRYLSPSTGQPCSPEQALTELMKWRDRSNQEIPWWRRAIRPLIAQH